MVNISINKLPTKYLENGLKLHLGCGGRIKRTSLNNLVCKKCNELLQNDDIEIRQHEKNSIKKYQEHYRRIGDLL